MDFYNLIKDFGSLIGILVTLASILAISYKFGGKLTKIDLELGNLKEDNKKLDTKIDNLDTKIDNLDKRILTLEVETKNLTNSINEVKVEMKSSISRVENRLDKIENRLEKSDERYMIFFTNRTLDLLKAEKADNKELNSGT